MSKKQREISKKRTAENHCNIGIKHQFSTVEGTTKGTAKGTTKGQQRDSKRDSRGTQIKKVKKEKKEKKVKKINKRVGKRATR